MIPQDKHHLQLLESLKYLYNYDFWIDSSKPGHAANIMVSPTQETYFLNLLSTSKIPYSLQINDIEE